MYICNFLKCFVCQGRKLKLEVKLKLMHVRALRIQEMIVLFLFILFSSMKEENLMKFVFQTVFLNITIPISAIQGDLNDIYAERIKSNYQEVANGLSKRNSLAGWKYVWSPASVCYKKISYELNGFAKTFKVQKKSIRLSKLLIFSDFLGKLGDAQRFKCYHFFHYTVNTRSYDANQGFPVKRGALKCTRSYLENI